MKYKATVSFAGEITMGRGEVRDVSDDIAAPLVATDILSRKRKPAVRLIRPTDRRSLRA